MATDDESILVACNNVEHGVGPGIETTCACGASIVHDPVMEANIRREYPGKEITFECLSCCAARMDSGDLDVGEVLENTMDFLPPEVAALGPLPLDRVKDYFKKFRRN